jgi:hypothetical protein
VTNKLKESSCDGGPLGSKGRYHQVETNTTVAMTTKKGHQKAKTNENHHMHILKHWIELPDVLLAADRCVAGWGGCTVRVVLPEDPEQDDEQELEEEQGDREGKTSQLSEGI